MLSNLKLGRKLAYDQAVSEYESTETDTVQSNCTKEQSSLLSSEVAGNLLAPEAIQRRNKSVALQFKCIYHVHSSYHLPPTSRMLSVFHCITHDVFKENFENRARFLIDQSRNTLHPSATSEASNGRLCNALNNV